MSHTPSEMEGVRQSPELPGSPGQTLYGPGQLPEVPLQPRSHTSSIQHMHDPTGQFRPATPGVQQVPQPQPLDTAVLINLMRAVQLNTESLHGAVHVWQAEAAERHASNSSAPRSHVSKTAENVVAKRLSSLQWNPHTTTLLDHLKEFTDLARSILPSLSPTAQDAELRSLLWQTLPREARERVQPETDGLPADDPFYTYEGLTAVLRRHYITPQQADRAKNELLSMRMLPGQDPDEYNRLYLHKYQEASTYGAALQPLELVRRYLDSIEPPSLRDTLQIQNVLQPSSNLRDAMRLVSAVVNSKMGQYQPMAASSSSSGPVPMEIGAVGASASSGARPPPYQGQGQGRGYPGGRGPGGRGGGRGGFGGRGRQGGRGGGRGDASQSRGFSDPTKTNLWRNLKLRSKDPALLQRLYAERKCYVCEQTHGGKWWNCPNMSQVVNQTPNGQSPGARGM